MLTAKEILYDFGGINTDLFIAINKITNIGVLPYFLEIISNIFFIANFAICYLLIGMFYLLKKPPQTVVSKAEGFIQIGFIYMIFGFTFATLKFASNLPRPFCSLDVTEFLTITNIEYERCLSSFPSAHTGLSFLILYIFWKRVSKTYKALLAMMVLLVGMSRISLSMHYPSDILYSVIITYLIIKISEFLFTLKPAKISTEYIKKLLGKYGNIQ